MKPSTHVKLAVVSLVIAAVLWLGVHNEDRVTIPVTVPVTYEHPDDIVRLSDVGEVEVRVRATRNRLATVSSADVSVLVDNSDGFTGTRLEILDRSIETSFGIEVESVEPARIPVEYDRIVTVTVPVEVSWGGDPAEGWRVDEDTLRAEPGRVQVRGPSRLLASLERISTLPVVIDGASETRRSTGIGLVAPDPQLQVLGDAMVSTVVPIVPRIDTRSFPDVPIKVVRGEWDTTDTNPSRLEAVIEGPLPWLKRLPLSAIDLSVDCRGLKPQSKDYQVEVLRGVDASLCPDCEVVGLKPQRKVDVNVRNRRLPGPPDSGQASTGNEPQEPAGDDGAAPVPEGSPRGDVDGGGPERPGRAG